MYKVMDQYYFKELPPHEQQKQLATAVTTLKNIHSMDDISAFMSEEQNVNIPESQLQWKVWICADYSATQSVIIWKSHHVIGDGIGILLMLSMLQNEYDKKQWIQTTEVGSALKKALLFALRPVTALYAFYCFLVWRTDVNCLKQKNVKLVGKKVNSISMPLDVASLKKIGAHFNKATINDVVLALVSVSLKEYFVKHQDTKNTTVNMLTPFSLRKLPDTIEEHKLVNDFTLMCFTLDLTTDFEKAIGLVQKQTHALKKSIYPFGVLSLSQFIAALPSMVG